MSKIFQHNHLSSSCREKPSPKLRPLALSGSCFTCVMSLYNRNKSVMGNGSLSGHIQIIYLRNNASWTGYTKSVDGSLRQIFKMTTERKGNKSRAKIQDSPAKSCNKFSTVYEPVCFLFDVSQRLATKPLSPSTNLIQNQDSRSLSIILYNLYENQNQNSPSNRHQLLSEESFWNVKYFGVNEIL